MKINRRMVIAATGGAVALAGLAVFMLLHEGRDGQESQAQTTDSGIEKRRVDFAAMVDAKAINFCSAGDAIAADLRMREAYAYGGELVVAYEGMIKVGSITNRCMVKVASKIMLDSASLLAGEPRLMKLSPYGLSDQETSAVTEMGPAIFELLKKQLHYNPFRLGVIYKGIRKINNSYIEFER